MYKIEEPALEHLFSVQLHAPGEPERDAAVVGVHGEIDLETAPLLRQALLPVIENRTGPVVVDLSQVEFMDSTGMHVLVEAVQRLAPQHRRFAVVCDEGGPVHRVLGLVGLLDAIAVHRSRESAVLGGDDRAAVLS
ncbi:MAG: STAS domain-containing protein [Solirubrobacterales bacterium]|nr:STAS domain-containing protein [Solirubrobacterales bacterium]